MIWESNVWKDDLLRKADMLESGQKQTRWVPAAFARVEHNLMIGFYAIRKLIEAKKLCDSIVGQSVDLVIYPSTGDIPNLLNWHHIERFYNFEKGSNEFRNLLYVCHQIVHSYIFVPIFSESQQGLSGILFTSDRQRSDILHFASVDEIIRLFRQIGHDYPKHSRQTWNSKKGDYDITSETAAGPIGPGIFLKTKSK